MICLAFSGCHVVMAVIYLTISLMLHGAVSSGALASVVDISPNFAGVSLGINSTFSTFSGFISPLIVGYLTFGRQNSVEPWKYVFEFCAAMQIFCGILYILFSDSNLQEWNKPQENSPENASANGNPKNVAELNSITVSHEKVRPSKRSKHTKL